MLAQQGGGGYINSRRFQFGGDIKLDTFDLRCTVQMALPPSWSTPHLPQRFSSPRPESPLPSAITPSNPSGISYTTQLTPRISDRLVGDKVLLPQGSLEALLSSAAAAAASSSSSAASQGGGARSRDDALLPYPITFRLFNPANNRYTHAVPREFSAEEGVIVVSPFLGQVLGLESQTPPPPIITTTFRALPKATYARLRPLASGYDEADWKSLLERELRLGYSTLTPGEVLTVTSGGGSYEFLIDKLLPEGSEGVCVVDTDMEVEMVPLSEEQARETMQKKIAKRGQRWGGGGGARKEKGGSVRVGEVVQGVVARGEYVDFKLEKWDRGRGVAVELAVGEGGRDDEVGGLVDLLIATSRYRGAAGTDGGGGGGAPRQDEFVWGDLSSQNTKRVVVGSGNVELAPLSPERVEGSGEGPEGVEYLSISVHGYSPLGGEEEGEREEISFRLHISQDEDNLSSPPPTSTPTPSADEKICTNCNQPIPLRTYPLHTAFCHRNNTPCNFSPPCSAIFRRNGPPIRDIHWHCPHPDCSARGNDVATGGLDKHLQIFHTPRTCPQCGTAARNTIQLAAHRVGECPSKLALCRFCHLLLPQDGVKEDTSAAAAAAADEVGVGVGGVEGERERERLTLYLLSGLTHHEFTCGSRTTECPTCHSRCLLREFTAHQNMHNLERLSRPTPTLCGNLNCYRTIPTPPVGNELGLCAICYGPMYAPGVYDPPPYKHLRRRVERKLLVQGVTGCGRAHCTNIWCRTGRSNLALPEIVGGIQEVKKVFVKPLFDAWDGSGTSSSSSLDSMSSGGLRLCVDEVTQKRRELAQVLVDSGGDSDGEEWELQWVCRGVEVVTAGGGRERVEEGEGEGEGEVVGVGEASLENEVRKWLRIWAVRKGER